MSRYIVLIVFVIFKGARQDEVLYRNLEIRKPFEPGYVCNYETHNVPSFGFLLYTCVHQSQCVPNSNQGGPVTGERQPYLDFDNCPHMFFKQPDGGTYVCCHPSDNQDQSSIPDPKGSPYDLKFMPGFRSGFKCNDYKTLLCMGKKYCTVNVNEEVREGRKTDISTYPHLAALGVHEPSNEQLWYCLGSIISETYILTSSACNQDFNSKLFAIHARVGETNLCQIGKTCRPSKTAQLVRIGTKIFHPSWKEGFYYHDIMLFTLIDPIKWNDLVRPACLYNELNTYLGAGTLAYYAEEYKYGKNENTTHEIGVGLVPHHACQAAYSSDNRLEDPRNVDPGIFFCGSLPNKGKKPCLTNYGGAVQFRTKGPECIWQLYGVFVYSPTYDCNGNNPPLFARIPYYIDWIESEVWKYFNMFNEYTTYSVLCMRWLKDVAMDYKDRCKPK